MTVEITPDNPQLDTYSTKPLSEDPQPKFHAKSEYIEPSDDDKSSIKMGIEPRVILNLNREKLLSI